jgi:protein-L-isoaspartate(D-aspartate) O-methyltransferase
LIPDFIENPAAMIDYQSARLNMVESQVRPNKVTDFAVIEAMLDVPRERFVPEHLRGIAYVDEDVPLGGGRYLIEPMVLGRMLQLAAIGREDAVLDVGCATGYASAVLARLARQVVALEEAPALAARAAAAFKDMRLANVALVEDPLTEGYPRRAPYDVILFGGAVEIVPPAIADQLAEGGRLLAVVNYDSGVGKVILMTRADGIFAQRAVFDATTALLPGFAKPPSFVF